MHPAMNEYNAHAWYSYMKICYYALFKGSLAITVMCAANLVQYGAIHILKPSLLDTML